MINLDNCPYSVKNVKEFKGRGGVPGFNCSLYKGSRKIGTVHNSGHCGCHKYNVKREDLAALSKYAEELTGETFEADDSVVWALVDRYSLHKDVRKDRKKSTYIHMKCEPEYEGGMDYKLIAIDRPYSLKLEDAIKVKLGDDLIKVYNPDDLA